MNIRVLGGQSGTAIRDNDDETRDDGGRTNRRRQICYYQYSRSGSDQVSTLSFAITIRQVAW